ncbi:MAG: sulfite exporter TauE/SafE family protein [Thermodesulfobacteriota bacterium]|nr:sulfite exporter TauE/SafE family protein [Thermodesulfobacteriota bacterium]
MEGRGILFGISGALGTFVGAFIASHLPGKMLTVAFGIAIILGALRMLTAKPPKIDEEPSDSLTVFILRGLPLGVVSGIIGIGGGVLIIPIMVFFLKFEIHQAVGTSTALMIFTAMGGALSYGINGLCIEGLPPYSTGYLNWYQWIILAGVSTPWAGWEPTRPIFCRPNSSNISLSS